MTQTTGNLADAGNLAIQGSGGLTLGSGTATTTIKGGSSSAITFTLPSTAGSVNQCLVTNGSGGVLSFADCDAGGGGGSSGVTSLNGLNGDLTLVDPNSELGITTDSTDIDISLPQGLAVTDSPTFASLTLTNPLTAANGGTGIGSYTTGDLLYADSSSSLNTLSDVAAGSCLMSGGTSTAPEWGACSPPNTVTGTGTIGDLALFTSAGVVGSAALSQDSGNLTASGNLSVQGTGGLMLGSGMATTTILDGASSAITLTLPTSTGTSGQCLTTSGAGGVLSFSTCLSGASGGSSGVSSLNSISGAVTLQDTSGELTITPSSQDIGITLAATTVSPNSYGSASSVTTFTVNAEGQLTAAGSTPIAINGNQITTGSVAVAQGGTGIASYTVGSLIYASAATTLSQLNDVATGQCLTSGGTTNAPVWGSCGGSNGVTGSGTSGQIALFNGTNTLTASILNQTSGSLTDTGTLLIKPTINSTTALEIETPTNTPVLTVDTTDQAVFVGSNTPLATLPQSPNTETLTAGTGPDYDASGNFCNNGRADLAVTNSSSQTISLYCNTGTNGDARFANNSIKNSECCWHW